MMETMIVLVIVGVVVLLAVRSLYRTLTGRSDGCGCGKGACGASGHGCQAAPVATKSPEARHGD